MVTAAAADPQVRPSSALSTASTTPCPSAATMPTATRDRNGAYDANANPAAAREAPITVIPASAMPAAPGLKLSSPTPSRSPQVRPAATPAMMPAVSIMASSRRALAVTGKPVMASCVAPIRPIPARSMTIPAGDHARRVHLERCGSGDDCDDRGDEAPGRLHVERGDAVPRHQFAASGRSRTPPGTPAGTPQDCHRG